eukprot:CAMPEP_0206017944 /NCGR_PEP_ID=MMETSP1464-20131121/26077_1 /ASSEMBLY_ACC=CAM_ASM_001124 /TAXON_ID=119497 /ORGANISM="Exanthemachrysis gayraliae, Strain RCC1523" /LENGTH=48 /DNA_ID= /DNA_START= /DNA_END= /DNA_ORIENTATION=
MHARPTRERKSRIVNVDGQSVLSWTAATSTPSVFDRELKDSGAVADPR